MRPHGIIIQSIMQPIDTLFLVIIIMLSAVFHEVMHGVAADKLGDPTARYAGRLTFNPIKHLDPVGSVILPLFLGLSGSPIFFGWAKPVPYNPYNLRPGRWSEAIVAVAGPMANLALALFFGVLIRLNTFGNLISGIFFLIVAVNVTLCLFNLIPVPPLDGSKVLSALLPRGMRYEYDAWRSRMEQNPFLGMALVLIFLLLLGSTFGSFSISLAKLIAGEYSF
jgi:Zn-dependent protease